MQGFPAHPYLVAQLSTEPEALWRHAVLRDVFYIRDGKKLRAPRINETCCRRPQLAELLEAVGAGGPDVLYTGHYAQVGGTSAKLQCLPGRALRGLALRARLRPYWQSA